MHQVALFKPEDPGPLEPEPTYDDPKALPTIAIWLLLACAMAFSAAVAHQAQPTICAPAEPHDAAADASR